MTTASRSATVSDVARLASVSTATVSRALSRPELLAEGTLRRVHRAIAHLGYEPMTAAGQLRLGHHGRLGVLVAVSPSPEILELASMSVRAATARGRGAALHFVPAPGPARDQYLRAVNRVHSLDGLLDVDAQLSAQEIRAAGHTESTVVSASSDPELGFLAGRRLSSLFALSLPDLVVAVGEARGLALARLPGLAELTPNVIALWHDGTFPDAHRLLTDHVAAQSRQASDARIAYVALDAVAAGAIMLALAHCTSSVFPLVSTATHPMVGIHDAITFRAQPATTASRLVDQLIERIDHPGFQDGARILHRIR